MKKIEKECPICGIFFTTENKNRIYCESCGKNSDKAKKKQARALAASKRRLYEPTVITLQCWECGKEFQTIEKLKITAKDQSGEQHVFCSPKCKKTAVKRWSVCRNCGKSLEDSDYFQPGKIGTAWEDMQFCDEACEREYKIRVAKANGEYHECPYCGKWVPDKKRKFCDGTCYKKALAEGWKPERKAAPPEEVKQKEETKVKKFAECCICGKRKVIFVKPEEAGRRMVCSPACKEEYLRRKEKKRALLEKAKAEKKVKAKEKAMQKGPLCMTCKTSYVDCERMKSNFQYLPKGAHYDGNGNVVVCPKYTE